ncbi:MAG: adenylyltransferase/cytidyltransferase family protein [Lachnospiraceae bacterium]|nr:adenylyltransferase/cytidyltransferase family protein [Lachnospiraceae bacterium]
MKSKIVTIEELKNIICQKKTEGKRIAVTSGCFDIIHAGHITYLEEAKSRADILIVLLNSDSSVKKLKGKGRPINPEGNRAIVISGLESVDYVCIFSEETPCLCLSKLRPDLFIKGGDYEGIKIPEQEIMEELGGKVEYVSEVKGLSTTNILKEITNFERKG